MSTRKTTTNKMFRGQPEPRAPGRAVSASRPAGFVPARPADRPGSRSGPWRAIDPFFDSLRAELGL